MSKKLLTSNHEYRSCVEELQLVEIWVGEEFDEHCRLVGFDDNVVKTTEGFYYLRSNISVLSTSGGYK